MNRKQSYPEIVDDFNPEEEDYDEDSSTKANGYCHFNETGEENVFKLDLFGQELILKQNPSTRLLGHGAVVWDASVIFSKYMENNVKLFNPNVLSGRTVIELGSGCGLAGVVYEQI